MDARVRILNIGPVYRAGMQLKPGSYRVEVSQAGYQRHVAMFELKPGNKVYAVELVPKPVTQSPAHAMVSRANRQAFEPEMINIPGGSFRMGCVTGKECEDNEEPVHQVRLKPFKMGKYEVTQAQWRAVMDDNPSKFTSWFKDCSDCPVEQVSWDDIQGYLEKLNRKTGKRYRLPSEAEWEYAARAGTSGPFSFSGKISSAKANYDSRKGFDGSAKGKYRKKTLPVGSFPANPWGLHDVHGNVKEWVEDCGNGSYTGAPSDGSAWQFGNCNRRVLRGGSWNSGPWNLRAARRYIYNPGYGYDNSGFRLAQD